MWECEILRFSKIIRVVIVIAPGSAHQQAISWKWKTSLKTEKMRNENTNTEQPNQKTKHETVNTSNSVSSISLTIRIGNTMWKCECLRTNGCFLIHQSPTQKHWVWPQNTATCVIQPPREGVICDWRFTLFLVKSCLADEHPGSFITYTSANGRGYGNPKDNPCKRQHPHGPPARTRRGSLQESCLCHGWTPMWMLAKGYKE